MRRESPARILEIDSQLHLADAARVWGEIGSVRAVRERKSRTDLRDARQSDDTADLNEHRHVPDERSEETERPDPSSEGFRWKHIRIPWPQVTE